MLHAHSRNNDRQWDPLLDHLRRVADLAGEFAEPFGAGDLACAAGLLHDLGKCSPAFQAYLQAQDAGQASSRAPHAIWGAAFVHRLLQGRAGWELLGLPVQGHHGGLANGETSAQDVEAFVAGQPQAVSEMLSCLQGLGLTLPRLRLPELPPLRRELLLRMVFSALVDADYRATEEHFSPQVASSRGRWPAIDEMRRRFDREQQRFLLEPKQQADTAVKRVRREVYQACLTAANQPPGVYRLTVPTGGGKTRSGLAFALDHAVANQLRRIIVAIPYTSIIDQTARVYRDILGEDAVLEHHSQVPIPEDESQDPRHLRLRLASENWDATLVVTTTVQLFESLFARRPGRCRKLHNLARSVILLDEVQSLPPELLGPTLDVLRALVDDYGASVVLSTATQPAFEESPYLVAFEGLVPTEIVPGYRRHFADLRRVSYEIRSKPLAWPELADEIRGHRQALVVLNTRAAALALLDALGDDPDALHLSTLLCGAHRRVVLDEVRRRLDTDLPVKLVSTQVVEAGVDLDFPVAYRAVGPLDRIVQVAGRCNRNGRLTEGRVVVFEPADGRAPRGPYRVGLEKARFLLHEHPAEALHDPDLYREYFRRLFTEVDPDKHQVQEYREVLDYPEVAKRYRLIQEDTVPVAVDYGDGAAKLAAWLSGPSRETWQRLQPYLVNVYQREVERLERERLLEPLGEGLYRWLGEYDAVQHRGLREVTRDPSDLEG